MQRPEAASTKIDPVTRSQELVDQPHASSGMMAASALAVDSTRRSRSYYSVDRMWAQLVNVVSLI